MPDVAICVVAYNRIHSVQRLLCSLDKADYDCDVKLYISIDKSDTNIVHEFAHNFNWRHGTKELILHEENLGLRKHILSCGEILNKHDALIVLEDDIFVAPGFYKYAIAATKKYQNDRTIAGISLYNFPICYHSWQPFTPLPSDSDVFLMQNAQSWGQIWMKKQWQQFKQWYDNNCEEFEELPHLPKSICSWPKSSWLKYHTRYCIETNKYFVYPYMSYSTCFADPGIHCKDVSPRFQSVLGYDVLTQFRFEPSVIYDAFFENKNIPVWLGLTEKEVCVDYYGDKVNREHKQYWLSRNLLPYKVIKSFGLQLRPYELNIKYNVEGRDLFLYDTHIEDVVQKNSDCKSRQSCYQYVLDTSMIHVLEKQLADSDNERENLRRIIEQCHLEMNNMGKSLMRVHNKNAKHLKACRHLIILSSTMLIALITLIAFMCSN